MDSKKIILTESKNPTLKLGDLYPPLRRFYSLSLGIDEARIIMIDYIISFATYEMYRFLFFCEIRVVPCNIVKICNASKEGEDFYLENKDRIEQYFRMRIGLYCKIEIG